MTQRLFDLAVIGGGINGCGIARDAAGRGLSVVLLEQGDLAQGTSSASTKLIHGGLRYLEHYAFRFVRESLREREVLLRAAPHIIWPLRFVLPHHRGLRPKWMLRTGLFLYDHLGGREVLPGTRTLDLRRDPAGVPLRPEYTTGFEYSDCWTDDARLVVLNARDAAQRGADIRTRTRCTAAQVQENVWRLALDDGSDVAARVLVNLGGPWVADVLTRVAGQNTAARIRLVKGSHIVVPKLFDHGRCYIFQNADRRIVFAIPYEQEFTLIGTTDLDYHGDPSAVAATAEEIGYLCEAVSAYFRQPVTPDRVVWCYAGVRPLLDSGNTAAQDATRDYELELQTAPAPLLSAFGGKLTTYRRLAEETLAKLARFFPTMRPAWTARATLPGGDFPWNGIAQVQQEIAGRFSFLAENTVHRFARTYGTEALRLLDGARTAADCGEEFGAGLTARELDWLMRQEWAHTAADVLWRRTKLGLRVTAQQADRIEAWMCGG